MRETLEKKHPSRYDLLSEQSIRYFISGLVRKHKKIVQAQVSGEGSVRTRKTRFSPEITSTLNTIVGHNTEVMPRHAWKLLSEALELEDETLPEAFPSESSVRSKISSMQAKRRLVSTN